MSMVPGETCFNLNFSDPGSNSPLQSILLTPKQTVIFLNLLDDIVKICHFFTITFIQYCQVLFIFIWMSFFVFVFLYENFFSKCSFFIQFKNIIIVFRNFIKIKPTSKSLTWLKSSFYYKKFVVCSIQSLSFSVHSCILHFSEFKFNSTRIAKFFKFYFTKTIYLFSQIFEITKNFISYVQLDHFSFIVVPRKVICTHHKSNPAVRNFVREPLEVQIHCQHHLIILYEFKISSIFF